MGKGFRPGRYSTESEAEHAEDSLERDTRIRAYARRVQMRLPLFEASAAELAQDEDKNRG
jgi:hypothetical protein